MFMSLEVQVKEILENFENTPSEKIIQVLNQIKPQFKSELTADYLKGKIQKIIDSDNEEDKKKQCKALTPYLDWYIQGA